MKTCYTLCDHKCGLHESCARYLEGLNRQNTYHFDPMPYNVEKGKCNWFVELEAVDNIINIIQNEHKK